MARACPSKLRGTLSAFRAISGVIAGTLLLLAAPTAQAERLEDKQRAAKTACLSGDHAKGVSLLAELYVDTNEPMYLFNQGRCFEQNGRYEDAVNRFREYQRKKADAGAAPDPEAEKHIADCLSLIEVQKKAAPEPGPAPAATTLPTVVPPTAPAGPPPAMPAPVVPAGAAIQNGDASPRETSTPIQKKLGYAAMGLGVVGLGVGVVSYFVAKNHLDKSNDLGCTDKSCVGPAKDEYDSAQSAITVCNVSSIAGGILAVGGLVLVLTTPSPSPTPKGVAIVPVVGPGLVRLAMTGAF